MGTLGIPPFLTGNESFKTPTQKFAVFFFGTKITGNTHLGTDLVSTLSSLNVHDFTHSDDVLMSQF